MELDTLVFSNVAETSGMEPGLTEAGYNNKAPGYNVKQHPSGIQPTAESTGFQPVGGSVGRVCMRWDS
jgi:hypothetical protein